MSYHMSGSMGGIGGYGTIKVHLQNSEGISLGEVYKYKTGNSSTEHTGIVAYINQEKVLVDNNYTIGSNPPPFYVGQTLSVLVPGAGSGMGDIPLLTTVIDRITPLNEPPPGAESAPLGPPAGITIQNPMIGALSPQGQWTWSGVRWDNIPGPPLEEKTVNLYNGNNLRTFQLREEMSIEEFMSTVLADVPIEGIDELDSNMEIVDTYEPVQPEPPQTTTMSQKSQNRRTKKKKKFKLKKEKGKKVVPNNTRSITDGNTGRSIQPPGNRQSPGDGGRSATTQRPGGNSGTY